MENITSRSVPPSAQVQSTSKSVPPEEQVQSTSKPVPTEELIQSTLKSVPPNEQVQSTSKSVPFEEHVQSTLKPQDDGDVELTHDELMEVTSTTLNDLLRNITVLADLPKDVTLEEVNAQIAVQHGQSITVFAVRDDGDEIAAVVNQKGAKVIDLKHAIKRAVELRLKRTGRIGNVSKKKISWNYIWKTNHLCFEGERLENDLALLSELGIKNRAKVTFVRRLRVRKSQQVISQNLLDDVKQRRT